MSETSGFGKMVSKLGALISEKSAVEKVADNPELMAELLLLVRMSFADGSVNAPEAAAFTSILGRELDLDADEAGARGAGGLRPSDVACAGGCALGARARGLRTKDAGPPARVSRRRACSPASGGRGLIRPPSPFPIAHRAP